MISGGYFVSRAVPRPEYASSDLLPEHILSVSGCIVGDLIGDEEPIYDLQVARQRASLSSVPAADRAILGIAIPEDYLPVLVAELDDYGGEETFKQVLERHDPPVPDGECLGWEVLGREWGGFHSWLCNSLEQVAHENFGIQPSVNGLLASEEDARAVAVLANDEGIGAEPVSWAPWLVTRYPR